MLGLYVWITDHIINFAIVLYAIGWMDVVAGVAANHVREIDGTILMIVMTFLILKIIDKR